MKSNRLYAAVATLGVFLLWRPDTPSDIHADIQQRLLEAELGSATTFYFAGGSRDPAANVTPSDVLLENLEAAQPESRWQAARGPSERRDPRALSALTEAAFDPGNRDLRLCAIRSLGMIGDRRAVPVLIEAINTRNNPVTAANAIARMGDERGVRPMIVAADDPQLRLWMVMALGELGHPAASAYLASLNTDTGAATRQAAVEALWKIETLSASDPVRSLTVVLGSAAPHAHRTWAAFRLGELGQPGAIPGLLQALADPDHGVQGRVAAALVRLGQPIVPAARHLAVSAGGEEQRYAVAILGYIGGKAEATLLQSFAELAENDDLVRIAERSIDLISIFNRPADGVVELANL